MKYIYIFFCESSEKRSRTGKANSVLTSIRSAVHRFFSWEVVVVASHGSVVAVHQRGPVIVLVRRDLVEQGQQALPTLDHIAHRLVVEVVHVLPLHTLRLVVVLLRADGVVDEVLLQLLVHVVDAELLEVVVIEDLEAVNVEDAHC